MSAQSGQIGQTFPETATVIAVKDNNGKVRALQLDASGNLPVSVTGAGSGGTSSNFGSAFPLAGTAAGANRTTDGTMQPLNVDGSGLLRVAVVSGGSASIAGTAAITRVGQSATSVQALAANSARLGMSFHNDGDAIVYLKYGTTASSTSFTKKLMPGESWEPQVNYTGRVDVIWAGAGVGALEVTELTA